MVKPESYLRENILELLILIVESGWFLICYRPVTPSGARSYRNSSECSISLKPQLSSQRWAKIETQVRSTKVIGDVGAGRGMGPAIERRIRGEKKIGGKKQIAGAEAERIGDDRGDVWSCSEAQGRQQ